MTNRRTRLAALLAAVVAVVPAVSVLLLQPRTAAAEPVPRPGGVGHQMRDHHRDGPMMSTPAMATMPARHHRQRMHQRHHNGRCDSAAHRRRHRHTAAPMEQR